MLHQEARSLPQKSNWTQIAEIIDTAVLKAMNSDVPTDQILEEAQKQIQTINS